MTPPILFLIFNRPENTARVFEAIRQARPTRLYVAADGPRRDREGEAARCDETRRIATAVDWPCEVHTLFRDANLGSRMAVSSGITWFFENEPEGIVLEDDCLPHPSFFPYCSELLARYRSDERVMVISGDNTVRERFPSNHSYCFSRFPLTWGWATWRRAWRYYDFDGFVEADYEPVIRDVLDAAWFVQFWKNKYSDVLSGKLDAWDYVWNYWVWAKGGRACIPRVNLVQNIGFGEGATHTTDPANPRGQIPPQALPMPITYPPFELHQEFERAILRDIHGLTPPRSAGARAMRRMMRKMQRVFSYCTA